MATASSYPIRGEWQRVRASSSSLARAGSLSFLEAQPSMSHTCTPFLHPIPSSPGLPPRPAQPALPCLRLVGFPSQPCLSTLLPPSRLRGRAGLTGSGATANPGEAARARPVGRWPGFPSWAGPLAPHFTLRAPGLAPDRGASAQLWENAEYPCASE